MTSYVCKSCETRFDLQDDVPEGAHCPLCSGAAIPAAEKRADEVPRAPASVVQRCACGETRRELVNNQDFVCVGCGMILRMVAIMQGIFIDPNKGEEE